MAPRSTRRKIKDQAQKCLLDIDRIDEHLGFLFELSGGSSDYINGYLTMLGPLIKNMRIVFKRFEEGL